MTDYNVKNSLKELSTELVVELFIGTEDTLFNFLNLVYDAFNEEIFRYIEKNKYQVGDIIFIYKGGNIYHIIANEFFKELPNEASNNLQKYYDKFFKRADVDFSIYINPNIKKYNKVFADMTELAYQVQIDLRYALMNDVPYYFDFQRFTEEWKTIIIEKHLNRREVPLDIFTDKESPLYGEYIEVITFENFSWASYPYIGDFDYLIKGDKRTKLNKKKNMLNIVRSEGLDYSVGDSHKKFNLVRTQVIFNYYIAGERYKIPGELIDVTIPHRDDNKLKLFFDDINYTQYRLTIRKAPARTDIIETDTLIFNSYTVRYLRMDLEEILFIQKQFDNKFIKRLNRLLYLYFIDLFIKDVPHFDKIQILQSVAQNINNYDGLVRLYRVTYQKRLAISYLLYQIIKDYRTLPNYNEIIETIVENSQLQLDVLNRLKVYCEHGGNFSQSKLYHDDFALLV